jgi:hypothetical protein
MTCAVCGARSTQTVVLSASAFGASDLDTRPPEMMRSALCHQVQECPSCGYCFENIAIPPNTALPVLSSPAYIEQRRNPAFPQLANRYLCCAMCYEALEKFAKAGWAATRAAWACDDEGNDAAARTCREKAILLFEKAIRANRLFTPSPLVGIAVLVDLFRRCGQFERALQIMGVRVPTIPGEDPEEHRTMVQVFAFERALAERGDRACYTIKDALSFAGNEGGEPDSA